MNKFEKLEEGKKIFYKDGYFSGDYSQDLYIKKTVPDFSNQPRYYLTVFSNIDGTLTNQGFIYFYLNEIEKKSYFLGLKVNEEFRNLNIASFLVASWIDFCLNNNYDFLGLHQTQRKPFLIFLLKKYGFEILDKSLYEKRPDVISICRNCDIKDNTKYLLFKNEKQQNIFKQTNIFKRDNYKIVENKEGLIIMDNIILPLQNRTKNPVNYELLDYLLAESKTEETLASHRK